MRQQVSNSRRCVDSVDPPHRQDFPHFGVKLAQFFFTGGFGVDCFIDTVDTCRYTTYVRLDRGTGEPSPDLPPAADADGLVQTSDLRLKKKAIDGDCAWRTPTIIWVLIIEHLPTNKYNMLFQNLSPIFLDKRIVWTTV